MAPPNANNGGQQPDEIVICFMREFKSYIKDNCFMRYFYSYFLRTNRSFSKDITIFRVTYTRRVARHSLHHEQSVRRGVAPLHHSVGNKEQGAVIAVSYPLQRKDSKHIYYAESKAPLLQYRIREKTVILFII